jgi:HK97 gp10 family phage protein
MPIPLIVKIFASASGVMVRGAAVLQKMTASGARTLTRGRSTLSRTRSSKPLGTKVSQASQSKTSEDEASQDLEEMYRVSFNKALGKASRSAKNYAKDFVPVRTGALKRSITAKVTRRKGLDSFATLSTNDNKYASFVEFGTRPHVINAKRSPLLKFYWEEQGKWFTGKSVNHPGAPAQPFLVSAVDKAAKELPEEVKKNIKGIAISGAGIKFNMKVGG